VQATVLPLQASIDLVQGRRSLCFAVEACACR
jgi:hypothetical protein